MKKDYETDELFKTADTMIGVTYKGSKSILRIDIMESEDSMIFRVIFCTKLIMPLLLK
jgi:hypothetical protein